MVRQRLIRVNEALSAAGVPFAICGGWAVAGWVATIDEEATRTTKDVDILLRREDIAAATAALEPDGFHFYEVSGVPMFLDGPDGTPKHAVHILWANERVKDGDPHPVPDVEPTFMNDSHPYPRVNLEGLVLMKLLAWRDHDRTHLRDMIHIGVLNKAFVERYDGILQERLQFLFDNPEENLG